MAGSINRCEGGTFYNISLIMSHPDYNASAISNDISLLRTSEDIIFTDFIQPIALPTHDTSDGIVAIGSGWGGTSIFICKKK